MTFDLGASRQVFGPPAPSTDRDTQCYGGHMKQTRTLAALLALGTTGCFTTKIYTPAAPYGQVQREQQWFTVGGLVPLSDPMGKECQGGLARAESTFGGMDILLNVGLAAVGGIIGAAACKDKSDDDRAGCISTGVTLAPFVFASRTVEYVCAAPSAASYAPRPGAWPPPAAPPPYAPPPGMPPAPPPGSAAPPSSWTTPPAPPAPPQQQPPPPAGTPNP
jgi:hypothetical protein